MMEGIGQSFCERINFFAGTFLSIVATSSSARTIGSSPFSQGID